MLLTEFKRQSIEKKYYGFACFIDLKKAFDTIEHEILLRRLSFNGFRGQVNRLLDGYLSHRCQFVEIGNSISDTLSVPYGVLQGSVLGPLFFSFTSMI